MDAITIDATVFPLGRIVMTSSARRIDPASMKEGLRRHAACDWGDLDPANIRSNELALRHGDRLLSAYGQGDGRFWIITEQDSSLTTILTPQEY